jgi:hypothetical protein
MKYLHFGVPTTQEKEWTGYISELGVHVTDPAADPYGIEWLKFDADSPMHELIKTKSHAAFLVDNLDDALVGKTVLLPPFSPMPGLRIAFIDNNGAIIEISESKTQDNESEKSTSKSAPESDTANKSEDCNECAKQCATETKAEPPKPKLPPEPGTVYRSEGWDARLKSPAS